MKRRTFLKSSLAGFGVAAGWGALPRWVRAEEKETAKTSAELKLSCQISKIPGENFAAKMKKLKAWGGQGVELHGNPKGEVDAMKPVLADLGLCVSALCWGSDKGSLVSLDAKTRAAGIDALKSALETAGRLGANGVIFVPCFHKQSNLKPDELDKILVEILPGLGDFAAQHGTNVLLEPLRKEETFYINRLEQGVRICKEVNRPGVAIMGDFYHMTREEKDEKAAFLLAGDLLRHVHIASRVTRKLPGTDQDNYVEGMRGLKQIGYRQYISFECGVAKGQDPEKGIPEAFRLLEKQWAEA